MGDDCNVTVRRDSAAASLPALGKPMEEKASLLPSRPESGEPGKLHKIAADKHVVKIDLHEDEADPLLIPSEGRPTVPAGFSIAETKLRPDAPPFTPESLARSCPVEHQVRIENVEQSFEQVTEMDDCCFVDVDLHPTDETSAALPKSNKQRNVVNPRSPKAGIRDTREVVKDPSLKPFSLTSTPRLKRSPPKIDLSVDSLNADVEANETVAVATEERADEPDVRETGPETGEPIVVRGHWRILRTAFVVGNRIQIAVFIASVVLCVVIVVYVFV